MPCYRFFFVFFLSEVNQFDIMKHAGFLDIWIVYTSSYKLDCLNRTVAVIYN